MTSRGRGSGYYISIFDVFVFKFFFFFFKNWVKEKTGTHRVSTQQEHWSEKREGKNP